LEFEKLAPRHGIAENSLFYKASKRMRSLMIRSSGAMVAARRTLFSSSSSRILFSTTTGDEPQPEATEAKPTEAKIEVTAAEWEAKIKEAKDCKDKMMYALAEAQNVRRRSEEEVQRVHKYASQGFAKDMLDVADNLQIALEAVEKSGAVKHMESDTPEAKALKSLYEGLVLTNKLTMSVLTKNNVEKIEALGVKFNPNFHEALFEVPAADKEPGTVAVVMKDGYMYKDRVLRPSKVGTVKARD
jgi:molecular chaperone GrpE